MERRKPEDHETDTIFSEIVTNNRMYRVRLTGARHSFKAWRSEQRERWNDIPFYIKRLAVLGVAGVSFWGGYGVNALLESGRENTARERRAIEAARLALHSEEILAATGTCAAELKAHVETLNKQSIHTANAITAVEYMQAQDLAERYDVMCEPAMKAGRHQVIVDDRVVIVDQAAILYPTGVRPS